VTDSKTIFHDDQDEEVNAQRTVREAEDRHDGITGGVEQAVESFVRPLTLERPDEDAVEAERLENDAEERS
jgi:hypothetical protein